MQNRSPAIAAKNIAPAVLLALTLGACGGGAEKPVEPNIFPTDYKTRILTTLRGQLSDPTGIRDAAIAEPALKNNAGAQRYIACLRYNAKDDSGRYAGNKEKAAFFYAGQLTQIVDANRELCGNAAYQPFPELQALCRSLDCKS